MKMQRTLLVAVIVLVCAGAVLAQTGRVINYKGWGGAIELSNDFLIVTTVPDLGGRTMQYQFGDYRFFYENPAEFGQLYPLEVHKERWVNYGGYKMWLAPQERWKWPPDAVLDGGRYAGKLTPAELGRASLTVTSPKDSPTGMLFARTLTIFPDCTRVQVDQAMRNISQREQVWSLWEVTQINTAPPVGSTADYNPNLLVIVPLHPNSRFPTGYQVMAGATNNPEWRTDLYPGFLTVEYKMLRGQIGLDSNAGWMAFADTEAKKVYVKRWKYFAAQTYPDRGDSIELWTDDKLPYLELEVLSPLVRLKPGKSYHFVEDWYAATCPVPIRNVNDVGVASEALAMRGVGKDGRLVTGTFGCFYRGQAKLVFYNEEGTRQPTEVALGEVSPLQTLVVNQVIEGPADVGNAERCEILITDPRDKRVGVLANAPLVR